MNQNKTILLVQKEETDLKQTSEILRKADYEVVIQQKAVDALDTLYNSKPSLVITDTLLSGLGGYYIAEEMQKNRNTRSTPVILLYSDNSPVDYDRNRQLNIMFSIKKPFKADDLIEKVKFLMREIAQIMLISTDRMFRTRAFNQIKDDGFIVYEEQKFSESLENLKTLKPHCFIIDDVFAKEDIINFIKSIKLLYKDVDIPVLMTIDPKSKTGFVKSETDIKEMQQNGIKAFALRQHIDFIQLYEKLFRVLIPVYQNSIRYPHKLNNLKEKIEASIQSQHKAYTVSSNKNVIIISFIEGFKSSSLPFLIKEIGTISKAITSLNKSCILDISHLSDASEHELNEAFLSAMFYALKIEISNIAIISKIDQDKLKSIIQTHKDFQNANFFNNQEDALALLIK